MARSKSNGNNKRTRLRGVRKTVRNSEAKPNFAPNKNKTGPKVRDFEGNFIGHEIRLKDDGQAYKVGINHSPDSLNKLKELYGSENKKKKVA